MYVLSAYGGRGRSFCKWMHNGTVNIRDKNDRVIIRVKDSIVTSVTSRTRHKATILRYGRDWTVKENRRIIHQRFYEPETLRARKKGGLWQRIMDMPLDFGKGTLKCYSSPSGACSREVFTYDNGTIAYQTARGRGSLTVYHPNAKLWVAVKGRVCLAGYHTIAELLGRISDLDVGGFLEGRHWELTIYDTDGQTIVTQGHYENRQKEGRWLEGRRTRYYMSGVPVNRSFYEGDPESWNPHDILKISNAQLRSSLLKRFGYDRLLEKVESKILDSSPDGGQLIEIVTDGNDRSTDKIMRLIKVICPTTSQTYLLRVPPDIDKFEQARQWTFGLRPASLRNGARLAFVRET